MLSVIILDNHEPNVIKLTYELLWREIKDIEGSELLVSDDWFEPLDRIKNKYVCFVESDCLVSSGYFSSQMGLFLKNKFLRKLAMLSSGIGVNAWHNKFYGYSASKEGDGNMIPERKKHSNAVYPVQVGYFPGAIIRKSMLMPVVEEIIGLSEDLVLSSTKLSLAFWAQGDGNRVYINPNTTYVTTEDYVNDIGKFKGMVDYSDKLVDTFKKESI